MTEVQHIAGSILLEKQTEEDHRSCEHHQRCSPTFQQRPLRRGRDCGHLFKKRNAAFAARDERERNKAIKGYARSSAQLSLNWSRIP